MRLFLILMISAFSSCSDTTTSRRDSADTVKLDTLSKLKSYGDPLLADTPKIIRASTDYIIIATSPYDKLYFGDKFSPYKMEPNDIADIEKIIDSLIERQNAKGFFKNKKVTDFKYQVYSVKTTNQKIQARVQAICKEQAVIKQWKSSRLEIEDGEACYFSFIYDLTDKKITTFSNQ